MWFGQELTAGEAPTTSRISGWLPTRRHRLGLLEHHAAWSLGIRQTRTKPRHAWTNGFVERLQGTILHERWCIQFRRQYFTGRLAMQRTLDAFMPGARY